jgi:hypothetical protein
MVFPSSSSSSTESSMSISPAKKRKGSTKDQDDEDLKWRRISDLQENNTALIRDMHMMVERANLLSKHSVELEVMINELKKKVAVVDHLQERVAVLEKDNDDLRAQSDSIPSISDEEQGLDLPILSPPPSPLLPSFSFSVSPNPMPKILRAGFVQLK